MDNMYMQVSFHSTNGGVNNFQVVKVMIPNDLYAGLSDVIKVFTSKKGKAIERAQEYIKSKN